MGFPAFCDRFERVLATLLKGCCGLLGGMCYSTWRCGICGDSEHGRNLGGRPSPANHRHPHQVPFVSGEGWLFGFGGDGRRCSVLLGYSGCCGLRSRGVTGLERGLVRVRVRVTLNDGGHRYSQREQLMSDTSSDQLTVPDDLYNQLAIPVDEMASPVLPSSNSSHRHRHVQRVASRWHMLSLSKAAVSNRPVLTVQHSVVRSAPSTSSTSSTRAHSLLRTDMA